MSLEDLNLSEPPRELRDRVLRSAHDHVQARRRRKVFPWAWAAAIVGLTGANMFIEARHEDHVAQLLQSPDASMTPFEWKEWLAQKMKELRP
jgi:hypothetical protein